MDYTLTEHKEEKVIKTIQAFFLTLVLYLLLILIVYFLLYQKIIFPTSQGKDVKITLNIQNIEPSTPAQTQSGIESDQQALEEATKNLFEKIASAQQVEPPVPVQEITKNIFEKIDASQEKVSIKSTTQEVLEKARLAKLEQKRLEAQKKEQEALAKKEAEAEKKAHLEKLEQERQNALAIAAAKEKVSLAELEQERLKKEKKKQEALAKKRAKKKKQEKLKKQKLAKAKARKAKQRRDKLARKQRLQQAKKRRAVQKAAKRKSNDPLANSILNASTSMRPARSKQPAMRMIKQFYGSEFNSFTKTQKRFIEKNLGSIYRITQQTLTRNGYPWVAQKTRQQGTAIVTFYLHPNGNISGLRLKRRIGYAALDKNTLKVIRIAYKDYPRPKTKTKITFYVEYSLY